MAEQNVHADCDLDIQFYKGLIAKCDADKKRLDWLEKDGSYIQCDGGTWRLYDSNPEHPVAFRGDTLRQVIDKARAALEE